MNFVIDSGNSAIKVGLFSDNNLLEKRTFPSSAQLQDFLKKRRVDNVIISSVKDDAEHLASLVEAQRSYVLTHTLPLPIRNLYATPATLGVDRLAGVCGAQALFPNQNCLVIDAGTCITFDFIDNTASYHGGAISPGMAMRFQAVHTFTAKLPLVPSIPQADLIGNSTETSIQSGVINGLLAEIEGIIGRYSNKFEDLKVILCGGDARFFENLLKASIFASPELVLIGLNSILNHNVKR